jgi:large subunit ribosomal protein L23
MKNPYEIIKHRRITEKARVLENLQHATSNKSLNRCKTPKIVFEVYLSANKSQIKRAVESIYEHKIKVISVNTISIPAKKRRVRGHAGMTARLKKAVVTLRAGDTIEEKA